MPVTVHPITIGSALRILALVLALGTPAEGALAWGEEGHRMVGDIATRYLSPKAKEQLLFLLKYDRLADGEPSNRLSLGEVANWADEIKDFGWGRKLGSWHFDDVPLCEEPEYSKYCRNGRCASAQIARQLDILKNQRAPIRRRNEALKWVVHLVGDIHQPLHAANRRDRGGNNVQVSFFGERDNPPYGTINLHTIWDVHMVRRLVSTRGGESAIVSAPIGEADKTAWDQGSVADWINESHAIARDFVYPALRTGSSCTRKIRRVVSVGEAYFSKAAPIIEIQIKKAGIRLARALNHALGQ